MKAIRIHQNGGVDVLQIDELPEPHPSSNEVKIKIKATSLNHMDLWVRQGIPGIGKLPLTLGCDACGEVVAVGSDVHHIQVNDTVILYPLLSCGQCQACAVGKQNLCRKFQLYGEHIAGTHCEFICVPADNAIVVPDTVDFVQAAAFPLVYLTSWHMLMTVAQLKANETVLVMGAASGVGSAAIEIAKLAGARVLATVGSNDKALLAKKLGADVIINHYQEKISERVKQHTQGLGVDVVFEHVGAKVWQECLRSLAWGGRLVTCGATSGPEVQMDLRHIFIKQQQILGSTMGSLNELRELTALFVAGKIKPVVAQVFDYKSVREAHQFLEKSQQFGKVVLNWS